MLFLFGTTPEQPKTQAYDVISFHQWPSTYCYIAKRTLCHGFTLISGSAAGLVFGGPIGAGAGLILAGLLDYYRMQKAKPS